MKFRTEIPAFSFPFQISHQDKLVMSGSCFAENIGLWLVQNKFDCTINPYGISYNPMSMGNQILQMLTNRQISEMELEHQDGLWFHYDFHSRFSGLDKIEVLYRLNRSIETGSLALKKASILILTFGTSYYYRHKKLNTIVSNCHKMPANTFEKVLPKAGEQLDHMVHVLNQLYRQNPDIKVILTVSPVRHWKDGVIQNTRSKARLHLLCERLETLFPNSCSYFPAYELMMDDLRDYRFYEADLLHPTEVAVSYIRNYFENSFFSESTKNLTTRIHALNLALNHKPFHPESSSYKEFQRKLSGEVLQLDKVLPGRFEAEKKQLNLL